MTERRPPRVLHLITGLGTGGAEISLWRLLSALSKESIQSCVVSVTDGGPLSARIESLGVPVTTLELRSWKDLAAGRPRLRQLIADWRPDVVQAWMYHANMLAWWAIRGMAEPPALIWSARSGLHDPQTLSPTTRVIVRVGGLLAGSVDALVFNSSVSAEQHKRFGYRARRIVVIPNGFSGSPSGDGPGRLEIRRELGLTPSHFVVGHVARLHRAKGNDLFLKMAADLARQVSSIRFMGIGRGLSWENPALRTFRDDALLRERCVLLGERANVDPWFAAMDLFVNPSRSEAFPNALAEAMLAGLPCVATDVGDTARILGSSGTLVKPGDARALREAVMSWLNADADTRAAAGAAGRQRILREFSLEAMGKAHADLYRELLSADRSGASDRCAA